MRLTVKTKEGEDVTRHIRVLSRVQKITELIVHVETMNGERFIEATIRRTNVPNERREMVDAVTGLTFTKLCGLFDVTARNLNTNKTERHTMWVPVEK